MSSWEYSQIGYLTTEKNDNNVKRMLECMGVDFNNRHGSEAGVINSMFYDAKMGFNNSDLEAVVIYTIINKLFGDTTIFYEYENGTSICDLYQRYEEIYSPGDNIIYVGDKDYCYDGYRVGDGTVYNVLQEECEAAALKKGIPIEWEDECGIYPKGDKFSDLCTEIIEKQGGLEDIATSQWTEDIPEIEIKKKTIKALIDSASKKGYNDLVELIESVF